MSAVYYFGSIGSGHFLHDASMRSVERAGPWHWLELDLVLCPGAYEIAQTSTIRHRGPYEQNEGEALLHHRDGWTALAFWDRSEDHRGGSNSSFIAEGTHDFDAMMSLARAAFPDIVKRFSFQVRLTHARLGGGA